MPDIFVISRLVFPLSNNTLWYNHPKVCVCVCVSCSKQSPSVPKPERHHNDHHARAEMYYPMGVAYPPEPLHMASPFAYDDPWGAQSQLAYSQTGIPWNHGNGYMANGGYHDGGFVPY